MGRSKRLKRWRRKIGIWAGLAVVGLVIVGIIAGLVVTMVSQVRVGERNTRAYGLTSLPGLEAFPEEDRRRALNLATQRFCPAGDGYTVAACLAYNHFCLWRRRNLRWIKAMAHPQEAAAEESAFREETK